MPNTKQPEQNKKWIKEFEKIYLESCFDSSNNTGNKVKDFITNLLKEQLNRVNKEVIGLDDDTNVKGYELDQNNSYNYLRQEQRQKLDLIKGEI